MEKATVLIVDDDPDITEAMTVILEQKGYVVNSAGSIEQAMESLQKQRSDIIILDVMMDTPQDGFILSRQLKQDEKYQNIPILMLTSVQGKIGIDFKSAAGDETWLPVDEYLAKPIKPDVLLKKIESLIRKR
ncbi:MAG: response regulator transcription factor [Sedimentisphaerales bacterium]|nr:response regulator transcription factor [Sedimentisphaerales bacterium]